jgi:hypothetical protein
VTRPDWVARIAELDWEPGPWAAEDPRERLWEAWEAWKARWGPILRLAAVCGLCSAVGVFVAAHWP